VKGVEELVAILDLEKIEHNIFRGRSPSGGRQRVFGGLVIAQSLVAAASTVPDRPPHSMHAYFVLPGDPAVPIVYEVTRIRDGKSFTTRNCVAVQHGRPIFSMSASFQAVEPGLDHAFAMPEVKKPDELPDIATIDQLYHDRMPETLRAWFRHDRLIEMRPVDLSRYLDKPGTHRDPLQYVWFRASGRLPDDPAVHRAVLAYLSDLTLLDTALVAHGRTIFEGRFQAASLDHALWFHRDFRADEWLLYAQDSPSMGGARGLTRGLIYSLDGHLVASVAQEGLLRETSAKSS
jgi:acyl-CoA thioesterase-2